VSLTNRDKITFEADRDVSAAELVFRFFMFYFEQYSIMHEVVDVAAGGIKTSMFMVLISIN